MKQNQVTIKNFTQLLWFSHMLCIITNENFGPKKFCIGVVLLGENHTFQYRKMGLGTCLQFPEKSQGPRSKLIHPLPCSSMAETWASMATHAPSLSEQGLAKLKPPLALPCLAGLFPLEAPLSLPWISLPRPNPNRPYYTPSSPTKYQCCRPPREARLLPLASPRSLCRVPARNRRMKPASELTAAIPSSAPATVVDEFTPLRRSPYFVDATHASRVRYQASQTSSCASS